MNVLMLGTLIPSETKEKFIKKGISPAPADIAQKYLVRALCEHPKIDSVEAICSPRIAPYPKVRVSRVFQECWALDDCEVKTVGYLNCPGFHILQRQNHLVQAAKKWAKKNQNEAVLVILYSMHTPFLKAAKAIKKVIPNAVVAMVVADLPQYMSRGNFIKRILKKLDYRNICSLLPIVDKYILYTKHMAKFFKLRDDQWMLMEGLFDTSRISCKLFEKFEERICIYAGSLDPQYAIGQLMEAFEKSKVDAKLYIYGSAAGGRALQEKYPNYKKAMYKGLLSPDEMFDTMRKATLLINPRPSDLELTKYSCPSKTFEYMASGTPVLMTKLPGLPEEYYSHLYFFESEDMNGFVHALERVLSLDDETLNKKGRAAAQFIKEHKSSRQQVERIIDFCC